MELDCGDTRFEMKFFGRFHSGSDILIYSPETRTLFTGDLFSRYGRPSMSGSNVEDQDSWLQAIKWIDRRPDIETVIDGHGRVLSADDLKLFTEKVLRMCKINKP
jgi:glyoxylase-like metal-dependent hydrolase (beta-lactamase superfamily II)